MSSGGKKVLFAFWLISTIPGKKKNLIILKETLYWE